MNPITSEIVQLPIFMFSGRCAVWKMYGNIFLQNGAKSKDEAVMVQNSNKENTYPLEKCDQKF